MGELIRAHDWEHTPVGSPETWPQGLRTALRILLTTQHPIFVFWGPELICFYNDSYSCSLGPEQHPSMLGQPAQSQWQSQGLSQGQSPWQSQWQSAACARGFANEKVAVEKQ